LSLVLVTMMVVACAGIRRALAKIKQSAAHLILLILLVPQDCIRIATILK
jgi:hypothetical protein